MSTDIEQDADCALYSGTFVYPCLDCGDTVHVVDTVRQPHDCQPLTDLHEVIAHAWWAGYDARTAFEPSGGVPAAHVGDETGRVRVPVPPLEIVYPLCSICGCTVEHDGDGFACYGCGANWSDRAVGIEDADV